jgi:two-component system cell cycle response regulator
MKILIADDDSVSLLYLQFTLQEWGYEVVTASDGKTACDILLQADGPLLAIVDWMMPGMEGIEVCREIRKLVNDRYIYLIILTLKTDTDSIVEALNAGADDFISKPFNAEELKVRVRAGRRICELEQALRLKATRDMLTGLYNRGAIMEIFEKELARNARGGNGLSLIFADLDHFKQTNDEYGHLAGDAVLHEVARRINLAIRPYDSSGRYGGEELIIVLPACDSDAALEVAERIRACIADDPIATRFGAISTSLSIGVVSAKSSSSFIIDELIQSADKALYKAKQNGRNRVELAD